MAKQERERELNILKGSFKKKTKKYLLSNVSKWPQANKFFMSDKS